jgi:hypothetical protein
MDYLLTNLNKNDIEKLNNSNIEWYPDDITDDAQEVTICFETELERDKAMEYLNIKNYLKKQYKGI